MARHVWQGRRGGHPRLAQAGGGLDVKRLNRELASAKAVNRAAEGGEDQDADAAALVANAPEGRKN